MLYSTYMHNTNTDTDTHTNTDAHTHTHTKEAETNSCAEIGPRETILACL